MAKSDAIADAIFDLIASRPIVDGWVRIPELELRFLLNRCTELEALLHAAERRQ